ARAAKWGHGGAAAVADLVGRIPCGRRPFSHVASTKDLPATPAPRFTPSSHEREPNCRDRRWQNALYTASDHPLAPTSGGLRAAPNKQKLGRPTGWARFVVRPRPLCERRRAGERAAEDRDCDLRRWLFLVRGGRLRQG